MDIQDTVWKLGSRIYSHIYGSNGKEEWSRTFGHTNRLDANALLYSIGSHGAWIFYSCRVFFPASQRHKEENFKVLEPVFTLVLVTDGIPVHGYSIPGLLLLTCADRTRDR